MRQSRRLESSCRFLSTSSTLGPEPRLLADWSDTEQNPFVEVVGPATGVFSAISLPSAEQRAQQDIATILRPKLKSSFSIKVVLYTVGSNLGPYVHCTN